MKRFLSILMLVAMGVTLVACGTTKNSSEGKKLSTEDANDSAEAFDWIEGDIVSLSDAGKKMKKIVVPKECKELRSDIFYENDSVEEITFENPNTVLQEGEFYNCKKLKNVYLPENLKELEDYSFASCESLESIVIPDTVEKIGDNAFSHCKKLKSVKLGKSVKTIGKYAFQSDEKLENIEFNEGLEAIGSTAFQYCHSIKKIELKEGLKSIERDAFSQMDSLEEIYLPASLESVADTALFQFQTTKVYVKKGSWADKNFESDITGNGTLGALKKEYY